MNIVNKTHFDTRELRALACLAHRTLASTEGRARWWGRLLITVTPARTHNSAFAYLHGGPMRLRLRPGCTRRSALRLLLHELMHCYGYRHAQFYEPEVPATLERPDEPLGERPARLAPPRDLLAERAARAAAGLVRWQRKAKLAAGKVRQYRRRVRYYDRRLSAAGRLP